MEPLETSVANILESEGFNVRVDEGILKATKNSMRIFIRVDKKEDDLIETITKIWEERGGEEGYLVVIPFKKPEEEAVHIAETKGVLLWEKDNVEEERGISILRRYIKEPPSGLVKRIMKGEGRPKTIDIGVAVDDEEEAVTVEESFLPVNMDLVHVQELAEKNINGFSFNLELVPYFIYRVSHEKNVRHFAVNALDLAVEEWDEVLHNDEDSGEHHTKLEPQVTPGEALNALKDRARKRFSKKVEKVDNKGNLTIVQKEEVVPEESDLDIKQVTLAYRPLWCVEGIHGVMIIDAYHRKILELDYYRDDVIEERDL